MKSSKTKRIFVWIWVILALSAMASMYVVIPSIKLYHSYHYSFWIMLTRLTNVGILLIISLRLRKIVKAYTEKDKWQPDFYQKLRQIGFLVIALTLLNPILQIAINFSDTLSKNDLHISIQWALVQFGMSTLIQSPAMWVLSLSIFLFAELLQVANQIKAENESII